MTEPRNNEVQRFELAKLAMLKLLGAVDFDPTISTVEIIAETAVLAADALLAALDKPKEAK